MKKQLFALAVALTSGICVFAAKPTIHLGDEDLEIDTIFHATVGPGTTHTQLHLSGNYPLDVFYLTIDRSTPGVSMRVVCPGGKIAGSATTSSMARDNSTENKLYFAGTNGDFYYTSGKATDGSSLVGTPTYSAAVDGEVYRSSNGGYQFSVDADETVRICRLSWSNGTVTNAAGQSVPMRGVNNNAVNNAVTLYTDRGWPSPCQGTYAGSCAEVTAHLTPGSSYSTSAPFTVEITGAPTSTGDTPIPDGGCVLMARGSATDFVNNLTVGEIVTIDQVIQTPDGERVTATQIVSGNPKNVGGGVNLNSEAERGDATDRHPRTAIGFSQDGNTIIQMVVDGRGASKGVTTGMLADLMLYAGAYESVNIDGGGSSTLYTAGLGVRNTCSDGNERSVGNAVFAVYEGNVSDTQVARIEFADWRFDVPQTGLYTPRILAFNAAGIMIDNNYQDYTLSCPETLGEIVNNGHTLYANGTQHGVLTATSGSLSASTPVYYSDTEAHPRLGEILLDGVTTYTAEIFANVRGIEVPVNSSAYSWSSSDVAVATVSDDGVISPVGNGECTVTGTRGDKSLSIQVRVQKAPAASVPLESDASVWSFRKTGVKELTVSPMGTGLVLDYTMASSLRNPKIMLTNSKTIYGRPDALRIRLGNATVIPEQISVNFIFNNDNKNVLVKRTEFEAAGTTEWIIPFEEHTDIADITAYPIQFVSLSINPADEANATGHIEIPAIDVLYTRDNSDVENIILQDCGPRHEAWYTIDGIALPEAPSETGLYLHRYNGEIVKTLIR